MDESALNAELREYFDNRLSSWGRLLSMTKKNFDEWALKELHAHGYADFKMGHMPFLMNIHPDGDVVTNVAQKAKVSKQAISKVVKELTVMGLTALIQDEHDKRRQYIFLSAEGKKLVIKARQRVEALTAEYRKLVGTKKFEIAMNVLAEINDYHEKLS